MVNLKYGPIFLDADQEVEVTIDVEVPEEIAEAIEEGSEENTAFMKYDFNHGFTVSPDYFKSATLTMGGVSKQISYSTYIQLFNELS